MLLSCRAELCNALSDGCHALNNDSCSVSSVCDSQTERTVP